MFTLPDEYEDITGARTQAPSVEHHATIIKFDKGLPEAASGAPPVAIEIFRAGFDWYCHVRRGTEKTQPIGPYTTKQLAEQIQDTRRSLLAKRGTSMLRFIPD